MAALIFGFLGISVVWTLSKNWAKKYEERQLGRQQADQDADDTDSPQELDPAEHEAVYRKILRLRLTGFVLCLAAVAILYLGWHGGLALLAAAIGCGMQMYSFRVRHAHLKKYRFVPGQSARQGAGRKALR